MKLLVATSNRGKLDELRSLLPEGITLLTLTDCELTSPEEIGETFRDNALIKARSAIQAGHPVLAEDAGLEVDALDGSPGVRSARFAGPEATDAENNALLLQRLDSRQRDERRARFRSVVVLRMPDGREFSAAGAVEGRITEAPRGTQGFGYDPLFELDDPEAQQFNGLTAAELSTADKNRVSHRARALRALLQRLSNEASTDPAIAPLLSATREERGQA